jgi:hypothetical protein
MVFIFPAVKIWNLTVLSQMFVWATFSNAHLRKVRTDCAAVNTNQARVKVNVQDFCNSFHKTGLTSIPGYRLYWPRFSMVFFTPYRRISEYVNCPSTPCRRQRREELELIFLLNLGTNGGEWSASRRGHALPPGKDSRFPLDRRLGVSQSWSGHTGSWSSFQLIPY